MSHTEFQMEMQHWRFKSPLLPPSVMAEYAALIPDFAERYMTSWEAQASHRQGLERTVVVTNSITQRRGQVFALSLGALAIIAATVMAVAGQPVAAVATVGIDFVGLGGVFIWARRQETRDLERKAEAVPDTDASARRELQSGPIEPRPRKQRSKASRKRR